MNRIELRKEMLNTLFSIALIFVYSVSMNMFIVPHSLYAGGFMGICQLIRTLLVDYGGLHFGFDIASVIFFLINIPIFIYAWFKVKHKMLVKTVITVAAMTLFLSVIPIRPLLPEDILGSTIVGSIICGTTTGLILRCGASEGGLDIIGILMAMGKHETGVGQITIIVNAVQFIAYALLFDIRIVIYSMIYTFLCGFAIDRFHFQNINVEAKIVTKKKDEVTAAIIHEVGRGVTEWTAVGGYTQQESEVLYVIISKYEITQLRNVLHRIDPDAFVVISDKVHVLGNFTKRL